MKAVWIQIVLQIQNQLNSDLEITALMQCDCNSSDSISSDSSCASLQGFYAYYSQKQLYIFRIWVFCLFSLFITHTWVYSYENLLIFISTALLIWKWAKPNNSWLCVCKYQSWITLNSIEWSTPCPTPSHTNSNYLWTVITSFSWIPLPFIASNRYVFF